MARSWRAGELTSNWMTSNNKWKKNFCKSINGQQMDDRMIQKANTLQWRIIQFMWRRVLRCPCMMNKTANYERVIWMNSSSRIFEVSKQDRLTCVQIQSWSHITGTTRKLEQIRPKGLTIPRRRYSWEYKHPRVQAFKGTQENTSKNVQKTKRCTVKFLVESDLIANKASKRLMKIEANDAQSQWIS